MTKENKLCINCLKPRHFWSQCLSAYRCSVCQQLHHTLLHRPSNSDTRTKANSTNKLTISRMGNTRLFTCLTSWHQSKPEAGFLITCQDKVTGPNGYVMRARMAHGASHSMVSFHVANSNNAVKLLGRHWRVEAGVLPRVTTKLPTSPVPFSAKLQLADQRFGVSDSVNILLHVGANIFSWVMLHGWRRGPPGSSTALRTNFTWVLMGIVNSEHHNK